MFSGTLSSGTRTRLALFSTVLIFWIFIPPTLYGDVPGFLKIFKPAPTAKSLTLSEEEGPWMILAHTFVGEDSKSRAQRLAMEIRSNLKLPAYMYREKFDFTGDPGIGRRLRYANEYRYEAYAVLVGEYDSFQHPHVNRDLKKLKSASLPVFQAADIAKETDLRSPITTVKAVHQKLLDKVSEVSGTKKRSPMSNAFVTRNPMLPAEYFDSPNVDSFVQQLNEDKEFSLLECKGKYTVVVRTFQGLGTIVDGRKEKDFVPSMKRMDSGAEAAAKMVAELRKNGEEAYQFHDRYRSLVTVGSFDTLGQNLPGGRFEYAPEIRRVMQKYSALNSRHQKTLGGKQFYANHVAMIPFDVQPKPIVVPKSSKRSLYTAAFRTRQ